MLRCEILFVGTYYKSLRNRFILILLSAPTRILAVLIVCITKILQLDALEVSK